MIYDYKLKIHSCGISDCKPEWSWHTGKNGFPDYDIWTVLRGKGELRDGNECFPVTAGSSLLLSPNREYHATHDESDPLLVVNFHFDCLDEKSNIQHPLKTEKRELSDLVAFHSLVGRAITAFHRDNETLACVYLMAALCEFYETGTKSNTHTMLHGVERAIREICEEINSNIAEAPSLSSLAKKYGYSDAHLSRLFRTITGLPFSRYVINARISSAKLLLRSTDGTLDTIAEVIGYNDTSFFVKQFTKYVGVTPGKYRNG